MAIDFDGLDSKLEHLTAAGFDVLTYTILAWVFADGLGEGSFGRIFSADETTSTIQLLHNNEANTLRTDRRFSVALGVWTFPAQDNQWNAVAVSYDSDALNDPVARVNFADVAVTETFLPDGTAEAVPTGYCVGNRTTQADTWDGGIAYLQFFTSILSAADKDKALRCPGSVAGALLYLKMDDATDINDLGTGGNNGTGTSLTKRNSDPDTCYSVKRPPCSPWPNVGQFGPLLAH